MFEQLPPEAQFAEDTRYRPQWDRYTRLMVTVFLIVATIFGISLLAPVIVMLTLTFILAFLMYAPSYTLFRRTPLSYPVAVMLNYSILIFVIIFVVIRLIPVVVSGINSLVNSLEIGYGDLQTALVEYQPEDGIVDLAGLKVDFNFLIEPVRNFLVGPLGQPTTTVEPGAADDGSASTGDSSAEDGSAEDGSAGDSSAGSTGDNGTITPTPVDLQTILGQLFNVAGTVTGTVTSAISTVAGLVTTILLALFLSFLLLIDLPNSLKNFSRWIPPGYHREVALLMYKIQRVWNGFFRGQLLIAAIITLLTWGQLELMGVVGAPFLAIFTGLISLIPTLGGFIALFPLTLLPLINGSTVLTEVPNGLFALLVAGINLAITQVIWNVAAPYILGDALDLPLPIIVIGVFIGGAIGGILGAFLVAPIMGTIRVIVVYLLYKLAMKDPFPDQEPEMALGTRHQYLNRAKRMYRRGLSSPAIPEPVSPVVTQVSEGVSSGAPGEQP